MKKSFLPSFLSFLFVLSLAIVWSCSKKEETKPAVTAPTNVTTSAASNVTPTGATIAGSVGSNGGENLSAVGIVYSSTNPDPTIQTEATKLVSTPSVGSFSVTLTGLDAKTKYYAKAFATNIVGTTYGALINFTTGTAVSTPVVTSNTSATSITQTSAGFGGIVTADGGSPVTARGVCWNTSGSPTVSLSTKTVDGSGTGSFTSSITGLTAETTYRVRAYATNAFGTSYGNEISFATSEALTVTDIEGNVYNIVKIGNQKWMAENLKTTKFRDGTSIPMPSNTNLWANAASASSPIFGFVWSQFGDTYFGYESDGSGACYNQYAVMDPRKLCPAGWKVPGSTDFQTLVAELGGGTNAAVKLKSSDGAWWYSPGNNSSGFNALGIGTVEANGNLSLVRRKEATDFWSSNTGVAMRINDTGDVFPVGGGGPQGRGNPVRCLKEN